MLNLKYLTRQAESKVRAKHPQDGSNKENWINTVNHGFNVAPGRNTAVDMRFDMVGRTRPALLCHFVLFDFPSGLTELHAARLISGSGLAINDSGTNNNNILSGVGCYNEMNHTHTIIPWV